MLFFLSYFNNKLVQIFFIIIFNIIISIFVSGSEVYCMPEQMNNDVNGGADVNNSDTPISNETVINNGPINPILDTIIRVETTPRNIINMLTNLGLSGATLYAGYYGIRGASWAHSNVGGGTLGVKATLTVTMFATASFFGLGVYAISRRYGPSGPFINVNIGGSESNRIPVTDNSISNSVPVTENSSTSHTVDCPLEVGDILSHPFANLDPLADNPDVALLSISILMLFLGIQCLNLILIRMLLIKYAPRIQASLSSYPSLHNIFEKIVLVLNKTYKFYIYSFGIIGYFNLISAFIFLLFLINSTTSFN